MDDMGIHWLHWTQRPIVRHIPFTEAEPYDRRLQVRAATREASEETA
ncbi:hypothetical protein [Streptosporangium sp. NPDC000396]